ncbi:MAG: DUF3986 family protein [Streptococcaceae bacterium]|nr:DUF3986 family protein [Streptococcaceae bacterium]
MRRGYQVYVGKVGETEVDFVALKNKTIEYFQVITSMQDEAVQKRELQPLEAIPDNYPKTILSLDKNDITENGIQHQNITDWLIQN